MKKGFRLRGSGVVKALAFLLAWALATVACAGAGVLIVLAARYNTDYDPVDVYAYDSQCQYTREFLFLSLYADELTAAGEEWYAELDKNLSANETNFRYMIVSEDGDILLANNDATVEEANEAYRGIYMYSSYELGIEENVGYYLDLTATDDWVLVRGTEEEWSLTSYASSYYYEGDSLAEFLADANVSWRAVLSSVADGSLYVNEDYGYDYSYDSEAAMESASTDTDATEAVDEADSYEDESYYYYYYVYTGTEAFYTVYTWVDQDYPVADAYFQGYKSSLLAQQQFEQYITPAAWITGISLLLFLALLAEMTWAWGWNREGELALRGLNRLPIEAIIAVVALALIGAALEFSRFYWSDATLTYAAMVWGLAGMAGALGCLIAWVVIAAQIKTRTVGQQSLICRLLRRCGKLGRSALNGCRQAISQWALYWKVLAGCAVYYVAAGLFFVIGFDDLVYWYPIQALLLFLLLMLPPVALACKWAVDWAKLRKTVKEMVDGRLDATVDSRHMLPDLKDHANDLGSLSQGLKKAVEEEVKGQRFKTELITNVSHDLKTPLTSIINYVDLLKKADIPDETIRGYIDVLDRKSQRLKTLTEDLVEASKAASGTVAVRLERLDIVQLVEQAAAEYSDRLEAAGLTTILTTPEEPCPIQADGHHLWRVLDNLLGNCTKYAMPGTRVYLDVSHQENDYVVTVKNISADPLNVPPEELMKRFVRGDASRTTEGSGLGLSIARNLTNVQGGQFDLVVDGDLFKAVITFPSAPPLPEEPEKTEAPKTPNAPPLPEPPTMPPETGPAEAEDLEPSPEPPKEDDASAGPEAEDSRTVGTE
ncbi:MAG: HAMP domain-containing histidine kinase [Clostridiales bacterium]|nr:HAMP domain-containing histidine kinase [Clostridiales bacterium]